MTEKDLMRKIDDLEVKDNFEELNDNILYDKYTKKTNKNLKIAFAPVICFLLLILIIPFLLINKSEDKDENVNNPETPIVNLESGLLYKASNKVDLANLNLVDNTEYQTFVHKIQLFSSRLAVAIYQDSEKNQNFCVSPLSVYMALSMVIASGDGVAQQEILTAVGVTKKEVVDFTKYLYAHLKMEKYKYDDELEKEVLTSILDLNNSIWINDIVTLKNQGLENLANNFNADSYHVPFTTDNEKANALLSQYVDNKTRGLIKPKLRLEEDTLFALVNTLYMKDIWAGDQEELRVTSKEFDFINANGNIEKTRLMITDYMPGNIYEGDIYRHFYVQTDNGYFLKLIVPKDGYSVSDIYTQETLMEVNSISDYNTFGHYTSVEFPSFEASYNGNLVECFEEDFDVKKIFTAGDHMRSLTDQSLFISQIIHETKLKVDEKGIEGAAVTIIVFSPESSGPDGEYHRFIVDRAFAYLLTDGFGNILFTGVVNTLAQ